MKEQRIYFIIIVFMLLFVGILPSSSRVPNTNKKISITPGDGISSTYSWNFTGFDEIYAINTNGDFFDFNNVANFENNSIFILNPIDGILNVSIGTYEQYILENVTSIVWNETQSFSAYSLYLVNGTTREYVNEEGVGSNNYANSYIDTNGLNIGDSVFVGTPLMNITAIEMVKVSGITREAFKLYTGIGDVEITMYFDVETGILLSFSVIRTIEVTGINTLKLFSVAEERKELIRTNAFTTSSPTDSSTDVKSTSSSDIFLFIPIFTVLALTKIMKRKNKRGT